MERFLLICDKTLFLYKTSSACFYFWSFLFSDNKIERKREKREKRREREKRKKRKKREKRVQVWKCSKCFSYDELSLKESEEQPLGRIERHHSAQLTLIMEKQTPQRHGLALCTSHTHTHRERERERRGSELFIYCSNAQRRKKLCLVRLLCAHEGKGRRLVRLSLSQLMQYAASVKRPKPLFQFLLRCVKGKVNYRRIRYLYIHTYIHMVNGHKPWHSEREREVTR